ALSRRVSVDSRGRHLADPAQSHRRHDGAQGLVMKTSAWCAALLLAFAASPVPAAEFPNQPIRFVIPFSAGGPTDTAARLIAEPLRRQLGQPIVIENRPGASGVPGTEAVVNGPNDGYTLVVGGIAPIVLVPAVKKLRYDVDKDLVPLGLI